MTATSYTLEENVGYILRQVSQRHVAIFVDAMSDDLTPTQFSAVVKLHQQGACSQNLLGRLTAMDAPTIKGVIDRLTRRGLTETHPDPTDARLLMVSLTHAGHQVAQRTIPCAQRITESTLSPLTPSQRRQFLALLKMLR